MNAKKNTIMNPSDIDGFYSTECFSTDVLKGYYNEII
jgi:hypothetical protein